VEGLTTHVRNTTNVHTLFLFPLGKARGLVPPGATVWAQGAQRPSPLSSVRGTYRRGPTKKGESLRYTWRRLRADSHTKNRFSSSTHTPVGPQKSFSRSNPHARSRSPHISALAPSLSFPPFEIVASPVGAVANLPSASKTCRRLFSQSAT